MATRLLPKPRQHWADDNNQPLAGGMIHTFQPGTNTPKATWQDLAKTTPHTNPIVLDARGEPSAPIYWDGAYKVRVEDENGVLVYSENNYGIVEPEPSSQGANILFNGNFEIDTEGDGTPDGWTLTVNPGNSIRIDSDTANTVVSGDNALLFESTDGNAAGTATSDLTPFAQDETLYFTGWVTSNQSNLANKVIVDWYRRQTTIISSDTLYDNGGTSSVGLTEFSASAVAPLFTRYFRIRIIGSDGNVGKTWFDYFQAQRPVAAADILTSLPGIRVLSGFIAFDGTVGPQGYPGGTSPGFTCTLEATGFYEIVFDESFSNEPAIALTVGGATVDPVPKPKVVGHDSIGFNVEIEDAAGNRVNSDFFITVIGVG